MIGNPLDREYFVIAGAVKTSGGSLNLSKGELALVNQTKSTQNGTAVIATVAGLSKSDKVLGLKLGVSPREATRSHSNKSQSTLPFSLDEVIGLRVSAPKHTEQKVDEIILGYDGINEDSAFAFKKGDSTFRVTLELKGDPLGYRGGGSSDLEYVSVNIEVPECDPYNDCEDCNSCENVDAKPIVMEAIERLRKKQIAGGQTVDQFVDITPVFQCDDASTATEIPYDYYMLDVCDSGNDNALALISQQYDIPVIRTERVGATSTYQVFLPQADGAPTDYAQSLASLIKGCDACPAGYTAVAGGVLYSVSLEDNGVDLSATVDNLPGYAAGTINREAGRSAGIGFYTLVLDNELTSVEIAAFLATDANTATATIELVGDVAEICTNGTITTTAWVVGDTCNAVEETYNITLPDTDCGADILTELNASYSQTVTIAQKEASSVAITLTGTTGTALISIGANSYLSTFNTDLPTTAEDFDAAHSADIFANHNGMLVTSTAGVLTFVDETATFVSPTMNNASGDLNGTSGAVTTTTVNDQAACQTRYAIAVISNIVCDECDDIFKDFYVTDAPASYGQSAWELDSDQGTNPSGFCLTGIRIKGKTFILEAEEALRDTVGFLETSTLVRAAAGYPIEIREGIGRIEKGVFLAKQISRFIPRTHLSGNLRDLENESRSAFRGFGYKDYLGRLLTGEISSLEDQMVQNVMYTLQVESGKHAAGFGGRVAMTINYNIWVEVGRQDDVEALLNDIATNAGLPAVRAFGA